MRDFLYAMLNLSNWFRAAKRGRLHKRVVRHALGRATGKGIGRITR